MAAYLVFPLDYIVWKNTSKKLASKSLQKSSKIFKSELTTINFTIARISAILMAMLIRTGTCDETDIHLCVSLFIVQF